MSKKKDPGIWAVTSGPFQKLDGELLESGMLADAEVKCAGCTWKVHKVILCTRSDWFKKALMGPFEASSTLPEGQTGSVTITDFEPADIDCLLKFVYTGVINPRKSYPKKASLPALMKIWKMADFFCFDVLRDLVIKAAKDYSREMALSFCAFDPPDGNDQKKVDLFDRDFVPAVKAIYEDEMQSIKRHFGPIILGLAVASIHSFSEMEEFEKILRDIPPFAADWAIALMKGHPPPAWYSEWGHFDCSRCRQRFTGPGVVDTFAFMRQEACVVCTRCYGGPDLENWKNSGSWG